MRIVCAAAVAAYFLAATAQAATDPWSTMAANDLRAVRDLVRANHPGPVDPQNPQFHDWMEKGLNEALARARSVRNIDDYERTLRYYANGFADGHLSVWLNVVPYRLNWAGFVVKATSANDATVVEAEADAGVPVGATLVSCDGRGLDNLLADRIDPYHWNRSIPHTRYTNLQYLFFQDAEDRLPKLKVCTFSSGAVTLTWRHIGGVQEDKVWGAPAAPRMPSIRNQGGIWLVSIPTFEYDTDEQRAAIQSLVDTIKRDAPTLRSSTVIFDVRHNNGGSSMWGEEIAAAMWGETWVKGITSQFDETVDWRASPSNLATLNVYVDKLKAAGNKEYIDYVTTARDAVALALRQHRELARVSLHPGAAGVAPPDPVTGKVYFLTDMACGSACLDFADIMRRLPHVTQIGLPTFADSVYLEADEKTLPSGLAGLEYPMKVYRNRPRKNNEWYEPQIRWPGGNLNDDDAVIRWVKTF